MSEPVRHDPKDCKRCAYREELSKLIDGSLREIGHHPLPPVHACPMLGDVVTPCCGQSPFELPTNHRMSLVPELVTCKGRPRSLHEQGRAMDVPIVRYPLYMRSRPIAWLIVRVKWPLVRLLKRFKAWWTKEIPTRPLRTYDDLQDAGVSWRRPADPDVNPDERQRRALVLQAIADGHHWGYDIGKAAKLRPGRLYPTLHRLLEDGELVDEWHGGRRLYRLRDVDAYLDELHRCSVLAVIGDGFHFGDDISKATGLPHAKVYAILDSLLERGEVIERWEDTETETTRRRYHLNDNPDLRMRMQALSDPTHRRDNG